MAVFADFERQLRYDPGQRGLAQELRPGTLAVAGERLMQAQRVAIATGFFIPKAGAIESDGPPGTAFLARALESLGKEVVVVCPLSAVEAMEVSCGVLKAAYSVHGLTPGLIGDYLLDDLACDVFVALEYAGQGADGYCSNMRCMDVTPYVPVLDGVLNAAKARGIYTLAIGDGGNELGCGTAGARVAFAPNGIPISSVSDADTVVCAGISNWGAYSLIAVLSVLSGELLLPTADDEYALLKELCAIGVVDGVTGLCQPTVDGVSFDLNIEFLRELHELTEQFLEQKKVAAATTA